MTDFIVSDTDERVFILNNIELLTAMFHGPTADGWVALFDSGLPELLKRAPLSGGHLTDSLARLQDSRPLLSRIIEDQLLETEYVRLFVAAEGGVPAPLYESCHRNESPRTMGASALSMRTRLAEAGLEVALDSNEPADHLCIELEYLYHQLTTSWSEGRPDREAAACVFARDVMLPWVRRFREAVSGADPAAPFLCGADHLVALLEHLSKS